MALIHLQLPDDLVAEVDRLLRSIDVDAKGVVNVGEDGRLRDWRKATAQYSATKKVPDGYVVKRRGKTEWLVPKKFRPEADGLDPMFVTKRGLFIALLKIALRHPKDEVRKELKAAAVRKGRPPKTS